MKRKFDELRTEILNTLMKKPMSRMELAKAIHSDYRTIERQLIWLLGLEKIKKIQKDNKVFYRVNKINKQ